MIRACIVAFIMAGAVAMPAGAQDADTLASQYLESADRSLQDVTTAIDYYNDGIKDDACDSIRNARDDIRDTIALYGAAYTAVSNDTAMAADDRAKLLEILPGVQEKMNSLRDDATGYFLKMC